ncbi:MAG: hypothetical protein ACLT5Z_06000 [Eisenbergiella sp.]
MNPLSDRTEKICSYPVTAGSMYILHFLPDMEIALERLRLALSISSNLICFLLPRTGTSITPSLFRIILYLLNPMLNINKITEIPEINRMISVFCSGGASREQINKQKNPMPLSPVSIKIYPAGYLAVISFLVSNMFIQTPPQFHIFNSTSWD